MMEAQRGWSIEETANKLLEVSARAQERARLHDEGYALIIAQDAAAAAIRGRYSTELQKIETVKSRPGWSYRERRWGPSNGGVQHGSVDFCVANREP
jgi:hypothetical protein